MGKKLFYEGQWSLFDLYNDFVLNESNKENYSMMDYLNRKIVITDMSRLVHQRDTESSDAIIKGLVEAKSVKEFADKIVLQAPFCLTVKESKDFLHRVSSFIYRKFLSKRLLELSKQTNELLNPDDIIKEWRGIIKELFQMDIPEDWCIRRLNDSETNIELLMNACVKTSLGTGNNTIFVLELAGEEPIYFAIDFLLRDNHRSKRVGFKHDKVYYQLEDGISFLQKYLIPWWVQATMQKRVKTPNREDTLLIKAIERMMYLTLGRKDEIEDFDGDIRSLLEQLSFGEKHEQCLSETMFLNGVYPEMISVVKKAAHMELRFLLEKPLFQTYEDVSNSKIMNYCAFLLALLIREKHFKVESRVYDSSLRAVAAKVFQTKKNIPNTVKEAMKASSFNNVFGFVEFDESVDLSKIAELEKCFAAVHTSIFNGIEFKNYELRIRKCGRYHASGLFFPFLNCMCVDPRNTGSFCHETWHLIDYKYGSLSGKYNFLKIAEAFERVLRDEMKKNSSDPEIAILQGKSKYNLDYYLEPTEIFARCGELYLLHKGINNSVQSEKKTFVYRNIQKSEELMGMIIQYYEQLCENVLKS